MTITKKVLADNEKKEDESSEFAQIRQAALAEALEAKQKTGKTFTQKVYFFFSHFSLFVSIIL